jgi:two-component system phosphate regulon response regulator OmpR
MEIIHTIPHILVVDDDVRLRKLLARYLSEQGLMVTCASDANDARIKLKFFKYDAMVLDMMMPHETGIAFLSKEQHLPPTLMLTAMGAADDRIAGLEAGADDYLSKPFEPKELVLRLQKIVKRTKNINPQHQTIKFGDYELDLSKQRLSKAGAQIYLTDGEFSLLLLLAKNLDKPLSRQDILQHVAIETQENNLRTADVLITRLRKKIENDPSRPIHLVTIRGEGYVLRG